MRTGWRGALRGAAIAASMLLSAWSSVEAAPRAASINLCTDQLLLMLADPEQILGLSPFVRDPQRSWMAQKAAAYPLLTGSAEDVLVLQPDLVLAGTYTKRATRELLRRQGLRIVEFPPARSIDEAVKQIRQLGGLLGQSARAEEGARAIEQAVARVRSSVGVRPMTVLPLSRRGWASGRDTLIGSLVTTLGLQLAGSASTRPSGGIVSLEEIIVLRPDRLLVSSERNQAEDQGGALLRHSALEAIYPPEKRIVLPEMLTACGGPMLAETLDRMAEAIERGR